MPNITKPSKINVWNQFDEFGLLAGLAHWSDDEKTLQYVRYPGESNKLLKERIITANKYRGDSTLQGMVNNISRDLSVSPSGGYSLPIYNTKTKKFFYLSEKPYPGPSGIRVYVNNILVYPQVRASGYPEASYGWIVWNEPDFDPNLIPAGLPGSSGWYRDKGIPEQFPSGIQYGPYNQILEFIGTSIPNTNDVIKVEYQIANGFDLYGQPIIDWRSDFSDTDDPKDDRFIGLKSEFPTTASGFEEFKNSHISIFGLDKLSDPTISGVFFDVSGHPTTKLVDLAALVNSEFPLYWNRFRYDIGRWDQLLMASVGSVPSFHDESLVPASGLTVIGGSRYGIDLDCVELRPIASGVRSPWYPVLCPGEFYIGNERFYLFGNQQSQKLTLTAVSGILSGNLTGNVSGWPLRLGTIAAYSSGIFYDDISLPNNPYFKRLYDFSNVISGMYYRTPSISYSSSGFGIAQMNFNTHNFYYDYENGCVYASGINPTGFVLCWEHPSVYVSGALVVYSGGYGLTEYDFNPLTDPFDKILFIEN